jgi:hypothetical protein
MMRDNAPIPGFWGMAVSYHRDIFFYYFIILLFFIIVHFSRHYSTIHVLLFKLDTFLLFF